MGDSDAHETMGKTATIHETKIMQDAKDLEHPAWHGAQGTQWTPLGDQIQRGEKVLTLAKPGRKTQSAGLKLHEEAGA